MYGHRPTPSMTPRYLELLELLKNEYENMYQEISVNKLHREDAEIKSIPSLVCLVYPPDRLVHSQLVDINSIQKALFELERSHLKMKQHYEEEIAKLKHELEERGGPSYVPGTSAAAMIQFPTPPNLEAELASFASGFTSVASETSYGKRGPEEETGPGAYGRNVRSREDIPIMRRTSTTNPHVPLASAAPSYAPAIRSPTAVEMPLPKKEAAPQGAGFDWLVVYNPKASRTISIDLMHTLQHESVVCCVRFSQDGRFLATGSNRVTMVFDVKSGERLASLSDAEGVEQDQYVRTVAFSPDGTLLVTGSEDHQVRVWNIAEQKLLRRIAGHDQDVYSLDFLADGKRVASGSGDRTIRIWNIESGECTTTIQIANVETGRDGGFTSVTVSPNGKYLVAGSLDRTIRIYETNTFQAVEVLEGHRDSVYSVAFTPDGRYLISGSLDKTIKVWQVQPEGEESARSTCKYTILGHKDFVLSVAGTPPDGRWIVSGSKDRSVQFWDSQSGTTQLMLQGHKNSVISVAISPVGGFFATGSGDNRARIWSYSNFNAAAVLGSNVNSSQAASLSSLPKSLPAVQDAKVQSSPSSSSTTSSSSVDQ